MGPTELFPGAGARAASICTGTCSSPPGASSEGLVPAPHLSKKGPGAEARLERQAMATWLLDGAGPGGGVTRLEAVFEDNRLPPHREPEVPAAREVETDTPMTDRIPLRALVH